MAGICGVDAVHVGDILSIIAADGLEYEVHIDPLLGQQGEDLESDARLVGQPYHGHTGHIFIAGYAADVQFFHGFCNLLDFGAGLAGKAGENLQVDAVALGHLHRTVVEHLGAQGGQLQHLVVGDLLQLPRPFDVAGICGVDAVHVGINLAEIRVEHSGQGHRRGIGAAPAQGGDILILVEALEAGDDDNGVLVQLGQHPLRIDALDAGVAIGGVGAEARLPARQGDHRVAHGLDGHGAQGAGDLLAGGQQHIHLPLGGVGVDLRGLGNQIIRGVALGGEDRHDPVAPAVGLGYDAGHVADAVGIRDGAAAEFLNDESHWYMYPLNQEYPSVAEEARSSATFYALSPAPGTWSRASYPSAGPPGQPGSWAG